MMATKEETRGKASALAEAFRFCPRCGSPRFADNDWKSRRCADCGFVYYLNPSSATAAFILNPDNRLLVIHRNIEPAKGMLDLPGGFCDIGESLEQGVVREVKEETGLCVDSAEFLFSFPNSYLYSGFHVPTLDSYFLCRVGNVGEVRAADDAADAKWVGLDEVNPDGFAFESTRRALAEFIGNRSKYLKK